MRFGEQVSGQRSEAAKTVRHEHAILQRAPFEYCAQKRWYVKARSSPGLHNSPVGVLREVWNQWIHDDCLNFVGVTLNGIVKFWAFHFDGEKEKGGLVPLF
jgi:hypothetical protein